MTAEGSPALTLRPGSPGAWWLAIRPRTLTAGATPVLVGTAVAYHEGSFQWLPALGALAGALLLQIASNLANDVLDHERGADTAERLGPTRTVQAGLLSPTAVKRGLVVVLTLAVLVGTLLAWVGGWPIVAIGIASILAALAYTGGPWPLAYHGLGDLFVMLFFGFVAVLGTVWVEVHSVPALAWIAALAVGALATNILVVNNHRDRETDRRAGKRTLAVRLGRRGTLTEYALMLVIGYAVPLALVPRLGAPLLLPLLTLPLAFRLFLRVVRDEGRALNASLGGTAQLLFLHGVTFALALVLVPR